MYFLNYETKPRRVRGEGGLTRLRVKILGKFARCGLGGKPYMARFHSVVYIKFNRGERCRFADKWLLTQATLYLAAASFLVLNPGCSLTQFMVHRRVSLGCSLLRLPFWCKIS